MLSALLTTAALAWPAASPAQTFKVQKYSIGRDGGTDYLTAEPGTGRVFVSRGTHVMAVDGTTGKVLGDIPDTPRTHGIALAPTSGHGFITNGGDSTVTMFDLRTLAVIKKMPVATGGLDGILYDDFSDRIILTNHSRPIGTMVALDSRTRAIVGTVQLEDTGPEGAASDGKGKIFINNEGTNDQRLQRDHRQRSSNEPLSQHVNRFCFFHSAEGGRNETDERRGAWIDGSANPRSHLRLSGSRFAGAGPHTSCAQELQGAARERARAGA